MVIGNNPQISLSLFAPQYTMAAVIANEFTEAADDLYLHALVEIGLVLFVITLVVNALSRLLIWSVTRERRCEPRDAAGRGAESPHELAARLARRPLLGGIVVVLCGAAVVLALRAARSSSSSTSSSRASRALNWDFFTQMPKPVGETGRRHGERHRRHAHPDRHSRRLSRCRSA